VPFTVHSDQGEDYIVDVYETTFLSLTTMNGDTACDTVTIVDDSDLEGSHDVGFFISGASVGGRTLSRIQFMGQFTSVEIEDNEGRKPLLIIVNCFGGYTFSYVLSLKTHFFGVMYNWTTGRVHY